MLYLSHHDLMTTFLTKRKIMWWTPQVPGYYHTASSGSTHFLHQYTSPFATLTSVLFYKEGLCTFF
jgi:hypothetical protein